MVGGGAGTLAFLATSSLLLAGGAGLAALLYTWIFAGRGAPEEAAPEGATVIDCRGRALAPEDAD